MTEQVEQWIYIKFFIKREHSSTETLQMIQKAAAMGNWWLAASSQQHAHACITSRAEVFWRNFKSSRWLSPLWPRFSALQLLAFAKTKITLEREEISDHRWDSGKYDGEADGYWENYVKSQGAYFKGDWGIIVLCTMFLVSSSVNVSVFNITWLDTFWTDLISTGLKCLYIMFSQQQGNKLKSNFKKQLEAQK